MIFRNNKPVIIKFITIISVCLFSIRYETAAETVPADPDHISTGVEYRGVTAIRVGDIFGYGDLSFGGMAEMRNETRFNQGVLPNHNWRGFVSLYYNKSLSDAGDLLNLTAGFEHESAHPTMGFNDRNDTAYDKVYDSTYRNINMNSALLRLCSSSGSGYLLNFTGDVQFYYYSRNTPELPVNKLTWSEGISVGFEFRYPLREDKYLFISGFDRYIFQSIEKTDGGIYYDTESGIETRYEKYPIINNTNTISAKTGLVFSNIIPGRKISLYCGILYGNIYGFVDSREKRTVYSAGVEVFY